MTLAAEWVEKDKVALGLVAGLELCILLAGILAGTMSKLGFAATAAAVGLELVTLAAAARPGTYAARWRLPLISLTRTANMVLYPVAVDLLAIMAPRAQLVAAGSLANTWLSSVAATAHATALLVVPVAGVHACLLVALYWQLPPWLHLAVQAGSVAALMARAPKVCHQLVTMSPASVHVVEAVHGVLRHTAAALSSDPTLHLNVATAEVGATEKCAAVAWSLQVSLGFVLATLLVWSQQLRAVRTQGQSHHPQAGRSSALRDPGTAGDEAEQSFKRSQYGRVCLPVLRALDRKGGWAVPTAVSALAAFLVALIVRPGAGLPTGV